MAYADIHRRSLADSEGFWREAVDGIDWSKPFDAVIDTARRHFPRWFKGGELNTSHNALDRHVAAGRGDRPR